jgi:toxin ParE1/3/4
LKVEWHPLARTDFIDLIEYIAADNPSAAYRVHDNLREQVQLLTRFPKMGRLGRIPGTRELVLKGLPYIVVYRISENLMTILRVLHGARKWPQSF